MEKEIRKVSGGSSCSPWDEDGANGTTEPNMLEKILLDWILTEVNYSRYRGKDNNRTKKKQFAEQIARIINL